MELYFLITGIDAVIFNFTAKLTITIEILTKESKAKLGRLLVRADTRFSKYFM